MAKAKVFTVEVDNVPGKLGEVAQALADQKVNIQAFLAWGMAGPSPVQVVVDSPARAKKAFRKLGLTAKEEDVLVVTLPDRPGALASLGRKLGEAGVNINWAYGTCATGAKKQNLLLSVSDMNRAARLVARV